MFSVTRRPIRDPWLDLLYTLERRMGRAFEPFGDFEWRMGETTGAWLPVVDIFEEANALRIMAELPGVKPEDVKISVENNVLTISGMKNQVAEEKAEKVHRYERIYGSFERSFTLPATVDPEHIKATYAAGVLTLMLPKVEKAKPRQIKIEVTPQLTP
jgi:HSP20 family protein